MKRAPHSTCCRDARPYVRPQWCRRPDERGLALVFALMLMLGALILGVSVARTAFASMAAARMERERIVASAAAEAALADAEADIGGGAQPSSARAAWFAGSGSSGGSGGFADGCGHGSQDLGLCLPAAAPLPPTWQAIDLAGEDDAPVVPYGRYTGATLAVGGGFLPARLPAYLVEQLAPAGAGPPPQNLYRITAIGFGTRAASRVVLQAIYRRPATAAAPPAPGPATGPPAGPALPAGRISWREIPNWPELHARAVN
jgi:type IV pilus assembly protein PilX